MAAGKDHPPGGRAPDPSGSPWVFYLSCAPAPEELDGPEHGDARLVRQLFADLSDGVRRLLDATRDERVGFCPRGIPAEEARRHGPRALATALVHVSLCSPRYFESDECGRELGGFRRRVGNGDPGRPVPFVPLQWSRPTQAVRWLPAPLISFEFDGAGVDLYELMARGDEDPRAAARYAEIVLGICDRIVLLARDVPARPVPEVSLARLPNAFAPGRPDLPIYVLAPHEGRLPDLRDGAPYGPTSLDWNPYPGPRPLLRHLEQFCRGLGYTTTFAAFDDAPELFEASPPTGPGLLLIDLWALDDDAWRSALKRFDALHKPWIGVIVAAHREEAQTAAAWDRLNALLDDTLSRRFGRRQISLQLDARAAASLHDFGVAMRRVVPDASVRYLRYSGAGRGPRAGLLPPSPPPAARPQGDPS